MITSRIKLKMFCLFSVSKGPEDKTQEKQRKYWNYTEKYI